MRKMCYFLTIANDIENAKISLQGFSDDVEEGGQLFVQLEQTDTTHFRWWDK